MKEWSCRIGTPVTLSTNTSNVNTINYCQLDPPSDKILMETGHSGIWTDNGNGTWSPTSTIITINSDIGSSWQTFSDLQNGYDNSYVQNRGLPGNDMAQGYFDLYNSILHELGHALMLKHINDAAGITHHSLMYYQQMSSSTPCASDRVDLRDKSQPEVSSVKTNAVSDAIYIVNNSSNLGVYNSGCAPAAPSNLTPSANYVDEIDLKWDYALDIDYYTVTRNGITLQGIPAGTIVYSDFSLDPNTLYTYTVTSVNSFGSSTSASISAKTITGGLPNATSSVQTSVSPSGVPTFTWSGASTKAMDFTILRSTSPNGPYTVFGDAGTNPIINSFTDDPTTLKPWSVYYYKIETDNPAGSATYSSNNYIYTASVL